MDWLRNIGKKKDKGSESQTTHNSNQTPIIVKDPEMEKLLGSFMRTCWPTNYGDYSLGVDIKAVKQLRGHYLGIAKTAILQSLEKSPDPNPIFAASAIEMNESIPVMIKWIQRIRSQEDKHKSYVAHSLLARSLFDFTKDEAYLADIALSINGLGSGEISDSLVTDSVSRVPLTMEILSAVWDKLKRKTKIDESLSWPEACEDYLREKIEDPIGKSFLTTLPEIEQKELQSTVAMNRMQRIDHNRRFERFVVDRYNKADLNKYGEYIKVGGSPIPGLTLRCILGGHSKKVNSTSWSPDD